MTTDPDRAAATTSPPAVHLDLADGPVEVLDLPAGPGADGLAPVVFLHEGLGSIRLWRSFPHAVHAATGRRIVVWSRHGHGDSAVVTEPRAVTYMHHEALDVLPSLLARLDLAPSVLVGHSDGASIALLYAGRGGGTDRVTDPGGPDDATRPSPDDPVAVVGLAPHVVVEDESIAGIEAARDAARTTDLLDRMARHHRDAGATFWNWNRIWLDPAFRAWDITDHLPRITCPVLVVQGHDDEYGTLAQLDLVADGVTGPVERLELDHCGHAPHLDRPDATLAAVVAFLDTLP